MAEFKETGDFYASKSGSDANPGSDPNNPKLTIQGAINGTGVSGQSIIIGAGSYSEANLSEPRSLTYTADSRGQVILVGDGTNDAIVIQGNFIGRRNNITFTNYLNIFTKASGNVSGIYTGCVFNGGNLTRAGS
jgi:hypothetical protein